MGINDDSLLLCRGSRSKEKLDTNSYKFDISERGTFTGSVLAFQLLSPIFTNVGSCDSVSKWMAVALVTLCGASCFLLSFTDSFRDIKGNIIYGFATFKGLWVIDGSTELPPHVSAKYSIRFIDFMHAVMSILVFAAISLFDQNAVNCFFPEPSNEIH
jgi:hypothetical protein